MKTTPFFYFTINRLRTLMLLCCVLAVNVVSAQSLHIESGLGWKVTQSPQTGWSNDTLFDDSSWANSIYSTHNLVIGAGRYGPNAQSMWMAGAHAYTINYWGAIGVCFRKTIFLNADTSYSATFQINVDNEYKLYFDGELIGQDNNWNAFETYTIGNLQSGSHVIAIEGIDRGGYEGCAIVTDFAPCNPLTCPTLPVTLLTFTVEAQAAANLLEWQTATEQNNKGFEVEVSTNGSDFHTIGFVKGNGTTNTEQQYSFIDKTPASGINYYRLKQIDFDGKTEYSKVVSLHNAEREENGILIYPNPTTDEINIIAKDYEQSILTKGFAKGVYFVSICSSNGVVITKKVVKN